MAASRSTRVTRSSVGLNGLDENFCGRTLRNRSIAQAEESPALSTPRARSPKKRQDTQGQGASQQHSSPKGNHSTKVERETWASPQKRGPSCSERDCSDKSETFQTSPPVKRARCHSRSYDIEESLSKGDRHLRDSKESLEKFEDKGEGNSLSANSRDQVHMVSNGLDEQGAKDQEANSSPNSAEPHSNSDSLPNGCQKVTSPTLDVPCSAEGASSSLDVDQDPCANSTPSATAILENPLLVKEVLEEEVDVVGDAPSLGQTRVAESTNSSICAVQDNLSISGDPEVQPPSGCSYSDDGAMVLSTEHRYALRTSPRLGKVSPPKLVSPSRDHRIKEEEVDDCCTSPSKSEPMEVQTDVEPDKQPTSCEGLVGDAEKGGEVGSVEESASRSTKEGVDVHGMQQDDEDDNDDADVYYFESDHLALKHNKDYHQLLQTIAVLEAQRTQAILDLEALARHQKQALADPISFVEQLQKQIVDGLPCPQRVVQLPDINWDQYTSGLAEFEREFSDKKRNTRRMKLIFDKVGLPARPKSPLESKKEGEASFSVLPSSDTPEHTASSSQAQMIRGRLCDQNKSHTFNQLWTVEEQKKLEQLLLKFPPEEVESKRWQKIAEELGNRTAKQVASRVQKYFIKLTKAGIPVPGRTPNLCMYNKKSSNKRHHHLNKHLYRPSTFMTSYEPPVYMDDEDDRSSFYSATQELAGVDSDEEGIPEECKHLPEYRELVELRKLKKQKLQEIQVQTSLQQHVGFKCDSCGIEPIQGIRWHCQDCPQDTAVDFCSDCSDCLHESETHKPEHRLEPIYLAEPFLDRDYCLPPTVGYNYLDPNYFPANR